ncbi:unnamed protein product [Discula destructiva]
MTLDAWSWSSHPGLQPRQTLGRGPASVIAQLDFTENPVLIPLVWAVVLTEAILIIVVVLSRLLVRRVVVRQLFLDDVLIVVASFVTLVFCGNLIAAMQAGLGRHLSDPESFATLKRCVLLMVIGNILSAVAIAFTKLSIIASYMRVFPHRSFRITMHITTAITVGLLVASIPTTVFQCNPIRASWDFSITNAQCYDIIDFLYVSSGVNITTDLVLCTVPIWYLWSLRLPKKQKIIVSVLFFIGGLACVASIVKLAYLKKLRQPTGLTYNLVTSLLLTITECTIGIVCVSLPSLRPVFAKCLPSVFNSTNQASRQKSRPSAAKRESHALALDDLPSESTTPRQLLRDFDDGASLQGSSRSPNCFVSRSKGPHFLRGCRSKDSLASSDDIKRTSV